LEHWIYKVKNGPSICLHKFDPRLKKIKFDITDLS
jgi:hypothetical protein